MPLIVALAQAGRYLYGLMLSMPARVLLRLPLLLFFFLTSLFGLLSYVPFAYLQFLRHQLFEWLAFFVLFHHLLFWAAFFPAVLSVADDLAASRRAAWPVVAAVAAYGVWVGFNPVLPTLANDRRSLIIGLGSLMVPLAFTLLDHLASRGRPADEVAAWGASDRPRAAQVCAGTAVCVWLIFAAIAACRTYLTQGTVLNTTELALSSIWSLALHLTTAAGLFLVLGGLSRVRSPRARYLLGLACIAAAVAVALVRIVFAPIAFRGATAMFVAAIYGCSVASVWSGFAHRRTANPRSLLSTRRTAVASLAILGLTVFVAVELVRMTDWYFLLQKMIAFLVWIAGFGIVYRLAGTGRRALAIGAMAAALLVTTARVVLSGTPIADRWALATDRYAPHDASLMFLQSTLSARPGNLADVMRLLVVHSSITDARPAFVDFTDPLPVASSRPHIFLFVIDSLRRDYLSTYNAAVDFTPAIQAFATESLTFARAFTRYSGTGLSEPAIWSGALLPHKEYVTPFAPMNALERLLVAQQYRRMISVDGIMRQLLTPSDGVYELDRGVQNRHYQLCRTLDEVKRALPEMTRGGQPAFVFTQSQDVHLANVAIDARARFGRGEDAFYRPYAARIRTMDACFGTFIRFLKDTGLYDNSVVIVTSDHGDSLGDEGRWGHAYTVFPEVMAVPLIVRLPPRASESLAVDTDALAFTTDIAPTLYRLLGRAPAELGTMFGMPLVGATPAALAARRREPYIVASSYGPVYGLLEKNGDELYIIDAVNTAEHKYDLRRGLNGERVVVTDIDRQRAIDAIQTQVLEVSKFYGVKPSR
jgi:hypothetical protein